MRGRENKHKDLEMRACVSRGSDGSGRRKCQTSYNVGVRVIVGDAPDSVWTRLTF